MGDQEKNRAWYCPACRCAVEDVDGACPSCDTGKPPLGWPQDLYIGRVLGNKYRIDRRISAGGFAIVFLATQLHMSQEIGRVIVKMLHPEHSFEPVIKKRFMNEAKAARTIASPHVVKIFDLDFDKAMVPYMVQEYVEGQTLSSFLEKHGKIPMPRAVTIALQMAEGMKEAHEKGILHRDLKPENIILQNVGKTDFVKLIDFGIARIQSQTSLATASFIGTPRYMSPEQIQGRDLDRRSDIFSFGVVLFEMVAGEPPIRAEESEIEYLNLNMQQEPRKLDQIVPETPPSLTMLVDAMLKKDPGGRPGGMEEVIVRLTAIAEQEGWKADHTGAYHVASAGDLPHPAATADLAVHDLRTEVMPQTGRAKDPRRFVTMAILAGAALSIILILAAVGLILFSGGNGSSAGDAGSNPPPAAAAPDAATLDAVDAALEADGEAAETAVDAVPGDGQEAPPATTKPSTKKKTKKDDGGWTKI
jgi:tRNA A-37 threonylcarbamoyl transferase component Bud32